MKKNNLEIFFIWQNVLEVQVQKVSFKIVFNLFNILNLFELS